MAYRADNAAYDYDAYEYDMYAAQPQIDPGYERARTAAPAERPRFDVVTGAGREANQALSPKFAHVAKIAFLAVALIFVVGFARISLAGVTAGVLNANADLESTLESDRQQSSDLQVMRSTYGSDTRIRELATSTLGMVAPEGEGTTLDFTNEDASAQDSTQSDSTAADQAATTSDASAAAE